MTVSFMILSSQSSSCLGKLLICLYSLLKLHIFIFLKLALSPGTNMKDLVVILLSLFFLLKLLLILYAKIFLLLA